jgi:hypothetical protein
MGTGVWIAGVRNDVVRDNTILDNTRYGVLVTTASGDYVPGYVTVADNRVRRAAAAALAWDGTGSDNCFDGNDVGGETEPAGIETLYACAARPFDGTPYRPVQEAVAAAVTESLERTTNEPAEPDRPPCQKGRPGCHRH